MYMESFWRKHANDSDWDSRYIDIDRASALSDFTQTVVGSGTATLTSTGLVLVNSAGASDSIQYQYSNATMIAKAPKTPTVNKPSIYPYEMEFILQFTASVSPQSLSMFFGFCIPDNTIIPGHSDSIALKSASGTSAIGLDFWSGGSDQTLIVPAGGPSTSALGYLPTDGQQHELTLQVVPMLGTGAAGEVRVWLDGVMLSAFGVGDQLYWIGMTQQYLAAAVAIQNSSASLTAAQRTFTLNGIGFAARE